MSSFDEEIKKAVLPKKEPEEDFRSKIDRMQTGTTKPVPGQEEIPVFEEITNEEKAAMDAIDHHKEPKKTHTKKYVDSVVHKLQDQKSKTVKRRKPEPGDIHDEDRIRITENFVKEKKLSRKEKKRMLKGEKSPVIDMQKFLISFVAVAMFALVMFWSYAPENDIIMILVTIVGSALFLPIGMIIGWMLLDPYMRCKIARKITHKNFGIVNFVGKPNRVTGRIKNFDDDLIWIKTKCWAISKQGIYEVDKNGERATEGKILDPESFILVTETVPIMFVDINSMTPLRLEGDGRDPVSPEEIASIMKGWIDAQMAKLLFMKKTLNMMLLIAICAAGAAAYFGYMNSENISELTDTVISLKHQLTMIQEQLINTTIIP